MNDRLHQIVAALTADFYALNPSMKRFNPLTGRSSAPAPVIADSTKPKRAPRSKAKAQTSAESSCVSVTQTAAVAAPTLSPLAQAAKRVPLATYAAMLADRDGDAISAKAEFLEFCQQRAADFSDWRVAWRECQTAKSSAPEPQTLPNVVTFIAPPCPIETMMSALL